MDRGSVYRRCGCRDKSTGKLLGAACPGLRSREHCSWYFSADLPSAAAERHRARRGGFATRDAASAALEALASPAAGPEPGLSTGGWLSLWLESRVLLRASTSRGYAARPPARTRQRRSPWLRPRPRALGKEAMGCGRL
jgi:hypothetical protein